MTHSDVGLELEKRDLERRELETVLRSGIFDRAPNLELVLTYVCGKYFDGAASQIKEYSIAVDALGRPAEFDQKRDSIVRVEAHRLRKRLRDYYETEGVANPVRIEIPPGQYAPRFVPQPSIAENGLTAAPVAEVPVAAPAAQEPDPPAIALVEPTPARSGQPAATGRRCSPRRSGWRSAPARP